MPDPEEKTQWKTEAEALRKDLEAIRLDLAKIKPGEDLSPLKGELSQLAADLKALREKPDATAATLKPLEEKIAALSASLEAVNSRLPTKPAGGAQDDPPAARTNKRAWL